MMWWFTLGMFVSGIFIGAILVSVYWLKSL